jgi:pyrroloquinoline quinone (PQQ) biosynthesis protein C
MMNPDPLFRRELRDLQGRHPLHAGMHPFWRNAFRGRLPAAAVRAWAADVYPVVRDFSRLYLHVAAKCADERVLTFLAETIFEETGSGVEAESHPTLFRRFLGSLGVAEAEIPPAAATRAGREFHEFAWATVREGSFLEGLALVGLGIERPLPTFFAMIARAFQRQYGVPEADLRFFAVHTVADVKHSQLAARIVAGLAATPAERARVAAVLERVWNLQQAQLDELHRAAVGNAA